MKKQFVATLFILHEGQTLLVFHRKHQKWLPPGGHLENELPYEAALREAKEETGLDVELVTQENIWIEERINSASFPRPYLCLIENIPQIGDIESHQHIDFIYIGRPVGGILTCNHKEHHMARWFTLEEIKKLKIDHDIFADTYQICEHLLQDFPVA